jgi:hypothetical protein
VAVDGKTCRGARRADGTRVHLLGAAEHGGRLLDHVEVDVKHNETSHFTKLLEPFDLKTRTFTERRSPEADPGTSRYVPAPGRQVLKQALKRVVPA